MPATLVFSVLILAALGWVGWRLVRLDDRVDRLEWKERRARFPAKKPAID